MAAGAGPLSGALASRIATAAVLVAALLAALFLLPRPAFTALVAAIVLLAGAEWGRLCGYGAAGAALYGMCAALGLLACVFAEPYQVAFAVAALFWALVVPFWLWRGVHAAHHAWLAAAGFAVLVPAGLAMIALRPVELLLVLAGVWIADTAAYFGGRQWGRRKLAPAISPGKTREGAVAGVAGVLAYAVLCGALAGPLRWLPLLAASAILAVLSIYGDLFESAVKRQAGRKDSGALLPGHGGILDRIDSATAVLPVAALSLPWIVAD